MKQTLKGGYSSLYGIKNNKLYLITKYEDDYTFKFGIETLLSFKYYIKNLNDPNNILIEQIRDFFEIYDDLSPDDKVILNFATSYYFKDNEIDNLIRILKLTIETISDEKYEKITNAIIDSLKSIKGKYEGIVWKDSSHNAGVVEMADSSNNIISEVFEYYEKINEYSEVKYQ